MDSFGICQVFLYCIMLHNISKVLTACTGNESKVITRDTPDFLWIPSDFFTDNTPVEGYFTFSVTFSSVVAKIYLVPNRYTDSESIIIYLHKTDNSCSMAHSRNRRDAITAPDCVSQKYWVQWDLKCGAYQLGSVENKKAFITFKPPYTLIDPMYFRLITIGGTGSWEFDMCPPQADLGEPVCGVSATSKTSSSGSIPVNNLTSSSSSSLLPNNAVTSTISGTNTSSSTDSVSTMDSASSSDGTSTSQ